MGTYKLLFYGGLTLAIIFLILSIILFFVLKIPKAMGVITGRTEKKAIEEIRAGGTQKKKRKTGASGGGSITVRDVSVSSQNGSGPIAQRENDKIARAAARDARADFRDEERTVARNNAGSEATEVLKYGKHGSSEEATTTLGYDVSEGATDILGRDGGVNDDGATDVLTSDGRHVSQAAASASVSGDDDATDVLTSGKRPASYSRDDDATDVLKSGDAGEEKTAKVDNEEATDILREEEKGDDGILGVYAQDETAVLKGGMEEPDPEALGIRVIQSETVVHTDESL